MKEAYSSSIANIEHARYKLIGIVNTRNLNNKNSDHLIQAINIINKMIQISEERALTIDEASFLDTIIGITSINSHTQIIQERIASHLAHHSNLVNEIDPQIQSSWFTNILNYISCTRIHSAATVYPCDNSGLTKIHTAGDLLYRSPPAILDMKEERQKLYQENYKSSSQSLVYDMEPSYIGEFKMHNFDHNPDENSTCN